MLKKSLLLAIASLFFAVLLFEVISRFFILPSDQYYGILAGKELPPKRIAAGSRKNLVVKDKNLVVRGQKITRNDLWGIDRSDEILGYAPLENAVSANGWWQTNSLGARRGSEVAKAKTLNKKRLLVFGESFTQCSQVPLEESWPYYLEKASDHIEAINFGVSGYNMCQTYLRYKTLANKIDHDIVLLTFVPGADLLRDINVYRILMNWDMCTPTPRFVLNDGQLRLIKSPYKNKESFLKDNENCLSDKFKTHLASYDRLYFKNKYETVPIIGNLIIYKLLARQDYLSKEKQLRENLMNQNSEAVKISNKIFEAMNKDAQKSGAEFVLFILPTQNNITLYKNSLKFRQIWKEMVLGVTRSGVKYIDAMQDFVDAPESRIDTSYDGNHYGLRANQFIAELLLKKLT